MHDVHLREHYAVLNRANVSEQQLDNTHYKEQYQSKKLPESPFQERNLETPMKETQSPYAKLRFKELDELERKRFEQRKEQHQRKQFSQKKRFVIG